MNTIGAQESSCNRGRVQIDLSVVEVVYNKTVYPARMNALIKCTSRVRKTSPSVTVDKIYYLLAPVDGETNRNSIA
jgi:hypothetical protein